MVVALWLSFKDSLPLREFKHGHFTADAFAKNSSLTLPHICPEAPTCPAEKPLICPMPFSPERMSEQMFPVNAKIGEQESRTPWVAENNKKLRALFECLENKNCGENQDTGECFAGACIMIVRCSARILVIILGSYHFSNAVIGAIGSEDSWSVLNAHRISFIC